MERFDQDKVDDATLALLFLVIHGDKHEVRAWKTFDWETLDRLHEKGFIGNPKGKAKSVVITEEGEKRARDLFQQMFGTSD